MRIAVVVLTWNGREDTCACLAAVQGLHWADLDVIVADNGSRDETEATVRQRFPSVHIVQNRCNLGFAEGNNRGIAAALERGADAVLVLNNDAIVPPNLLLRLGPLLTEDVGAVSPVVHDNDGHVWFAGSSYEPLRGRAGRRSSWESGAAALPSEPVEITRAVGAAVLIPRRTIEHLGAFDADLFYLYEDVDWSLRIRAAGLKILLEPRATVLHVVAASQGGTSRTPLTLYYGTRNDLVVGRRWGGASGLRALVREVTCFGVHVGAALKAPRQRAACVAGAMLGWIDYRRHRLGRREGWPS